MLLCIRLLSNVSEKSQYVVCIFLSGLIGPLHYIILQKFDRQQYVLNMQFPSADEDEGDFTLTTAARSRLSSLFQSDGTSSGDVNQALTFQAPKQPKKNDNSQSSSGTFKLIHAATVHAYKLVDGSYANQGKLGCAILGIHENSSYKFLLYKGKQVQVTTCNIIPTFKFHVQPNNYVNFYDEKNENWSLNFDNETVLIEFAKQIALAKANSEGKSPSKLVIQDLTVGEGPSLETGHSAEVKYTGWLLTNYTFGQIFDSNMKSDSAFRLRLGKSKVIKGWSEGLIGARKGNRRLLVVPPSLAYGAEGMGATLPPNSTLIFDILVTKVKVSRESSHSPIPLKLPENSLDKRPEVLPRTTSISQEDNIRMRGASISEQLTQSPKKDKAQLISRMAKMGTAMLPLQGAVPAQVSSESENEEVPPEEPQPSRSSTASPKPLSKHSSRHNSVSSAVVQPVQPQPMLEPIPLQVNQNSSQMPIYSQASLPAQQPFVPQSIAYPSYPTQLPSPYHIPQSQYQMPGMMPASSFADTHLPMLVTETRSQNTEVRLSLSKITDKVDTVIQKVDELRLQGRSPAFGSAAFMDSALLVQNIERIVQENHQLKEDVELKNTKIQSLNEKICDLLQRNQRFFEESNSMLEQRSDSIHAVSTQSQAKLLNLEKEKANLLSELSIATSKMTTMENELTQLQSQENQLKLRLQEYEMSENQSKESNVDNESKVNSLQEHIKNLKEENSTLKGKLEELENKLEEVSKCNATLTKHSEEIELKIQEIESKAAMQLKEMKDSINADVSSTNTEIQTLRTENERISVEKDKLLSEAETLKTKYEVFYEKTLKMKTRYDSQIAQLMTEIQKLQSAGSSAPSSDFSGEIKKVMNILYKLLQGKFESDSSYTGTRVLEMTLETIRGLTFQMLQMKSRASSNSSEPDVETKKEPASGDTDANQSSSKDSHSLLDNSNKEGGAPEATNQQNGFAEENDQSEVAVNDKSAESEPNEGANNLTLIEEKEISTSQIDSDNKIEQSAIEGDSVSNSSDASSRVPDSNITEGTKDTPTDSKDADKTKCEKRASPEMWKPQPPLFDDDEEEEDDDDWLK
ncbi:hypothetical protein JTE90_006952 [Oedothorax gibbosus]|uniref:peptidylprolyl isomerase n=1 Tax=Oedothorax gibbosus TaxID=931172 RepID=A0AAV6U0I0_9ARAC|nr:hypothetical protein JTE90_006952 [Oedothorax gibbosus]